MRSTLTTKDVRADLLSYGQVNAPEQFRKKASTRSSQLGGFRRWIRRE